MAKSLEKTLIFRRIEGNQNSDWQKVAISDDIRSISEELKKQLLTDGSSKMIPIAPWSPGNNGMILQWVWKEVYYY